MTTYTFPADPIRVEVARRAGGAGEPFIEATIKRASMETAALCGYRDMAPVWLHGEHRLTSRERRYAESILLAEWAQWPEDGKERNAVELVAELKRLIEELDAPGAREGGV